MSTLVNKLFDKKPKVRSFKFEVFIIIEKDEHGYIAYCPALNGLVVEADTKEEVIKNFHKGFISYMQSILKHNDPIPTGSTFKVKKDMKPIIENIEVPLNSIYENITTL